MEDIIDIAEKMLDIEDEINLLDIETDKNYHIQLQKIIQQVQKVQDLLYEYIQKDGIS